MTKSTHWMHTVFYLNDVLDVEKYDVISGSIAVKKNKEYPREQDIKLSYGVTRHSEKQENGKKLYQVKNQQPAKIQFYSLK